ncbi:MAG: sugar transporter permease, partial [Candidatus Acidoferrum typicum]|nr:sugar transporter permease [Candidatus Acidoferrum typicum]
MKSNPSIKWLILFAVCALSSLPLLVLINTSLKPTSAIELYHPFLLPSEVTTEAWRAAWSLACIGSDCRGLEPWIINSLVIAIPSLLLTIVIGLITGLALTFRIWTAKIVLGLLVLGLFIPPQVVLYPLIIALRTIGYFGSTTGLVLVHVVWGLPFTGLLFRGYFLSIPPEVFQLARLDGASFAVILFRLILPIVLPAIAAASILQFTFIWNDFLLGLTFGDSFKQPVTVALQAL